MPDLSIGEIARRAGLRTSAIRYYEKVGLLPRAPRVSRQRRYEPQILDRLAVVRLAQFVGLRLSEIRWLLNDVPGRPPPERWRLLARQRLTQLDALMVEIGTIRELLRMTRRVPGKRSPPNRSQNTSASSGFAKQNTTRSTSARLAE